MDTRRTCRAGLRTLDMHEWIEIDRYYRPQIQLKAELLASSRRQEIFVCKDEAFAGAKEALEMLFDFLPQQFPNMFQGNPSRTKITNLITGRTFDLSDMHQTHPLEIAANLVQEDLVIMQRDAEQETYQANVMNAVLHRNEPFLSEYSHLGVGSLFSFGLVTRVQVGLAVGIDPCAIRAILPGETACIHGSILPQAQSRQPGATSQLDE